MLPMRVTVLLAIVLTIAFATAGFVQRQARVMATGTANVTSTITNPTRVMALCQAHFMPIR